MQVNDINVAVHVSVGVAGLICGLLPLLSTNLGNVLAPSRTPTGSWSKNDRPLLRYAVGWSWQLAQAPAAVESGCPVFAWGDCYSDFTYEPFG